MTNNLYTDNIHTFNYDLGIHFKATVCDTCGKYKADCSYCYYRKTGFEVWWCSRCILDAMKKNPSELCEK